MDSLIMERSYDMNRDRKTLVSIVVPCFNEEEVLPIYIHAMEKIIKEMKTAEVEIIFVDDGSTDRTAEILGQFHKKRNSYRYVFAEFWESGGYVCRDAGGQRRVCGRDGRRSPGSAGIYSADAADIEERGV